MSNIELIREAAGRYYKQSGPNPVEGLGDREALEFYEKDGLLCRTLCLVFEKKYPSDEFPNEGDIPKDEVDIYMEAWDRDD